MVDTIRTKAELLVDYQDNITRAILAQTHRNAVMSYMGCTGQLRTPDGPVVVGLVDAAVEFTVVGSLSTGVFNDPAFEYLELAASADGIYLFGFDLSVKPVLGGNNRTLTFSIMVDGTPAIEVDQLISNQTDYVSVGAVLLTGTLLAGQQIALGVRSSHAGGTLDWTLGGGLMFLTRQAGA